MLWFKRLFNFIKVRNDGDYSGMWGVFLVKW